MGALLSFGCGEDSDDGGGGTGDPVCDNCNSCPSATLWLCVCNDNGLKSEVGCATCSSSGIAVDCAQQCQILNLGDPEPENFGDMCPPEEGIDETGAFWDPCAGWDPASEVALISRVYHVDAAFIADLAAGTTTPSLVVQCDTARIEPLVGSPPGFRVTNASTTDLLYVLGLRNNDVPLTLNTMPLASYTDALAAYVALYLNGETEYELEVKRGSNTITLEYVLQ